MSDSIKTLETRLAQTLDPQERIDTLNTLAWVLRRDDLERSEQLSAQAIQLSQSGTFAAAPYQRGLAAGLTAQAGVSLYRSEYEITLTQGLEVIKLCEEHDLPDILPKALYLTAVAYSELGDLSEALGYGLRQLTTSEELGDKEGIATGHLVLGVIYDEQHEYEKALESSRKSIAVFRELNDVYGVVLQLNNISEMYGKLGDYDNALKHAFECLDVYRHADVVNPRLEIFAHHKIGEAYMGLNQFEKAQTYLEEAVALSGQSDHHDLQIEALLSLGTLHNRLNQANKAIPYLQRALDVSINTSHLRPLYRCHELLAESYKMQSSFEQALYHYMQFHGVKETVFNEDSNQKLKTLEVLHRTEAARKEAEYYASLYKVEQGRRQLAEVLNEIGQALTSTLEVNEVLDQILEQLDKLVHYDRGSVLLWNNGHLEFVAARGYKHIGNPLGKRVEVDLADEQDVFNRIKQNKKPLPLFNLENDAGWSRVFELPVPGAWLGVPLLRNKEVIGMLSLARKEKTPYADEAITLANTFAIQASVALENAQLYAQIRQFNEALEAEVQRQTEDLRDAYSELERLDRTKSDFIAVTAHELRTPITVLKGYGQILQKDLTLTTHEGHNRLILGIVNGANRLHEIVNTMLTMVKIDSRELRIYPEPLNVAELITQIATNLTEDVVVRQQTLVVDEQLHALPPIEGDQDVLKTVFSNIIVNAIKYTPDGGHIRVYGRYWETAPRDDLPAKAIEIVVSDTGIGIDPEAHELIFTKFYQTGQAALHSSGKTKFKGGGPGLGLAISRGIIEAHHGRLWAESEGHDEMNCPGSDFHIVLPLQQPSSTD